MRCLRASSSSLGFLLLLSFLFSSSPATGQTVDNETLTLYRNELQSLKLKLTIGLSELRNSKARLLVLQTALENQELRLREVEDLLQVLEERLRTSAEGSSKLAKDLEEEKALSLMLSESLKESRAEIDNIIATYRKIVRRWKFAAIGEALGFAVLFVVVLL